jgi:hypothetical protein
LEPRKEFQRKEVRMVPTRKEWNQKGEKNRGRISERMEKE